MAGQLRVLCLHGSSERSEDSELGSDPLREQFETDAMLWADQLEIATIQRK